MVLKKLKNIPKKTKIIIIVNLLLINLIIAVVSITTKYREPIELTALKLTIDNAMQTTYLSHNFDTSHKKISKTIVVTIPISEQIIYSTVRFKAKQEKLSESDFDQLLTRVRDKFLIGEKSSFAIFFFNSYDTYTYSSNRSKYIKYYFYFDSMIKECIYGSTDYNTSNLIGNSGIFDSKMLEGVNKGYLHFDNYRKTNTSSFSIHFSNFKQSIEIPGDDTKYAKTHEWAQSFDNSEVNFLSILEKGLDEEEIRKSYQVSDFSKHKNINKDDYLSIINSIITLVSAL